MNRKKPTYSIIIITILFTVCCISCDFAPGSYPYVERYDVNTSETELVKAVSIFKTQNPEFYVPEELRLKDGRRDSSDHWHHFYFYSPEENQIIKTWARRLSKDKTTFALVAVNDGLTLGNWKFVNKDLSNSENKKVKRRFEEGILNKVKENL